MPDIFNQQTRSRMMSGIRGKDTQPELAIRRGLHARGFRFRLHAKDVPGKPDLVLPRFHAAIFVNGCFWHRHDCHLFKMPATRPEFWSQKLERNVLRDQIVHAQLVKKGWRILVVWECSLKGRTCIGIDEVIARITKWLAGDEPYLEIGGA